MGRVIALLFVAALALLAGALRTELPHHINAFRRTCNSPGCTQRATHITHRHTGQPIHRCTRCHNEMKAKGWTQ